MIIEVAWFEGESQPSLVISLALFSVAAVHRFVVLSCLLCPVLPSVVMQRERYNFIVFLCPLLPSFIALHVYYGHSYLLSLKKI